MKRKINETEQLTKDAGISEKQIELVFSGYPGIKTRRTDKKNGEAFKKTKKTKNTQQQQETRDILLDYLNYMRKIEHPDIEWVAENVPMLQILMNKVRQQKGIVEVLSIGQWNKVFVQLNKSHKEFMGYSQKELFNIYLKHVIQYEFYLAGKPLNLKKGVNLIQSIRQGIFIRGKLKEIMNGETKGVQMYDEEVVVFPKGVDELGIKYEDINLTKIQEECGNQSIEVRIQNPMDYGFNIRKFTNISGKMTIKQYCEYQKHVNDETYKQKTFGDSLKNGKIYFGVNFQPSKLEIFSQLWKHLQGNFLGYRQSFDLLSYLDHDIPGCSSPQFYLKVKGCWTGGHQENINMCAVNINHGPDASEWYTIPYEHVQKIRNVLNEKFKCDLYHDQGLWFEKINWFIENGYPIKRILQQKGDIVISGPGTLHWVRSFGIALQSAWNVFPMKLHMIQAALHRHHQNELIRHDRAGTIPLKALLIKLLDHQMKTLDEKSLSLIIVNIELWKSRQQILRMKLNQTLSSFSLNQVTIKPLGDVESVCLLCKQEVFMYYINDWDGDGIACLGCLKENLDNLGGIVFTLYNKYDPKRLKKLLQQANNRQDYCKFSIKTKMCTGNHIGNVKCAILSERNRKKQFQEYQRNDCIQKSCDNYQMKDGINTISESLKNKLDQFRQRKKQAQTQTKNKSYKCRQHQSLKDQSQPRKIYKCNNYHQYPHFNDYNNKCGQNRERKDYHRQQNYYRKPNNYRQHNNYGKNSRNQFKDYHDYQERRGINRQFQQSERKNREDQRYDKRYKTNRHQNEYQQRKYSQDNQECQIIDY